MQFNMYPCQDSPTQSASRLTHQKRIPGRPLRPGITCRYDAVRDAALRIASPAEFPATPMQQVGHTALMAPDGFVCI